MKRVVPLLFGCSLVLSLVADHAHGAPPAKQPTPKTTKKAAPAKKKVLERRSRGKAKAEPGKKRTLSVKGKAVSRRKGMTRLGLVPKGAKVDNPFAAMETKSSSSAKAIVKAAHVSTLQLVGTTTLTPVDPNKGGVFLSAYHANWRAGTASWMEPEITVEGDGVVSIRMPLTDAVAGKDLKVECKGEFASTMSVRGGVTYSNGFYTTNSADFSYVSDTLKFLMEVPKTDANDPSFSISMGSEADAWWTLLSCSVEQV